MSGRCLEFLGWLTHSGFLSLKTESPESQEILQSQENWDGLKLSRVWTRETDLEFKEAKSMNEQSIKNVESKRRRCPNMTPEQTNLWWVAEEKEVLKEPQKENGRRQGYIWGGRAWKPRGKNICKWKSGELCWRMQLDWLLEVVSTFCKSRLISGIWMKSNSKRLGAHKRKEAHIFKKLYGEVTLREELSFLGRRDKKFWKKRRYELVYMVRENSGEKEFRGRREDDY